ncbi:MAG: HI0074 family nucleotidyltransferase substrate-binding subunit [Eubacteriales bacterium]
MKKLDNFKKSYKNLQDIYEYEEPYSNIVLTGMVALYEICFEQGWKAMKERLEYDGFDTAKTGAPRMIIKLAYKAGMIMDEELWLEALMSRNNVAHAYNQAIAMDIVEKAKENYVTMFGQLLTELEKQE